MVGLAVGAEVGTTLFLLRMRTSDVADAAIMPVTMIISLHHDVQLSKGLTLVVNIPKLVIWFRICATVRSHYNFAPNLSQDARKGVPRFVESSL